MANGPAERSSGGERADLHIMTGQGQSSRSVGGILSLTKIDTTGNSW
jgi:hypothetical protein